MLNDLKKMSVMRKPPDDPGKKSGEQHCKAEHYGEKRMQLLLSHKTAGLMPSKYYSNLLL
jgi:hypothetical protein